MSKEVKKNLPASVRQKLLNMAHANAEDFQFVLDRYALERFMYRLSVSPHKDIFVVKGAMLFSIWSTERYRVTRDLDLSQQLAKTIPEILGLFRDVLQTKTPEDGITFNSESLRGEQIREGHPEGGVRITLIGTIERAKASLQIDIGFTQEVWPAPQKRLFPSSLSLPAPELLAYPVEAMVAEKFEAMIVLGMANSRMKDFYDIWVLSKIFEFEGRILLESIQKTFAKHGVPYPSQTPLPFTPVFYLDKQKSAQWEAFLQKTDASFKNISLAEVVRELHAFLQPILASFAIHEPFSAHWKKSGPWVKQ